MNTFTNFQNFINDVLNLNVDGMVKSNIIRSLDVLVNSCNDYMKITAAIAYSDFISEMDDDLANEDAMMQDWIRENELHSNELNMRKTRLHDKLINSAKILWNYSKEYNLNTFTPNPYVEENPDARNDMANFSKDVIVGGLNDEQLTAKNMKFEDLAFKMNAKNIDGTWNMEQINSNNSVKAYQRFAEKVVGEHALCVSFRSPSNADCKELSDINFKNFITCFRDDTYLPAVA